ncbi:unnamed protein product [Heterobilharzia americana]|nr:unnamed protein product [Heterobilharzia americana]
MGFWLLTRLLCAWSLFLLYDCSEICGPTDELLTCFTKILSFEAIGDIHRNLDGDRNGEVDYSETEKFLRKEFNSADAAKKSRMLNSDDPLISLMDLWQMWRNNPGNFKYFHSLILFLNIFSLAFF